MATEITEALATVTEPGVYDALPEQEYHRHPALSSSGVKGLLPPSCPARFHYDREHGRPEKRAFDLGHAAHKEVLGVGMDIVVVQRTAKDGTRSDAEDYRTKSAQDHRDAIYAEGKVPLLAEEFAQVQGMAAELRAHPWASVLFDPELGGKSEVSLFWHDDRYDIDRRARLDWMPPVRADGRLIVPDYKSCVSAERSAIAKSVYNFGYYTQDVFYTDGIRALGLAEDTAFVFVFQERTPPYLINVAEVDADAKRLGRARVDLACEVFRDCTEADVWPGYSQDVELISLPRWASYDLEMTA
jgi:hypothetical protein